MCVWQHSRTVGSNRHGLAADCFGIHPFDVEESASGGRGKESTAPYSDDAIHRLDDVSVASQRQRHVGVTHDHNGLQPTKVFVHPPGLGHLNARTQRLWVLLQLHLEPLEERHRIGGRAGETADHALFELPHLACVRLDDLVAQRDLTVANKELR